jgi:hypothetical protein
MEHAITVGEVLGFVAMAGGLLAVVAIIFGVIWFMNPFRSGH